MRTLVEAGRSGQGTAVAAGKACQNTTSESKSKTLIKNINASAIAIVFIVSNYNSCRQ
jgi:hypothetical protein